MGRVEAVLDTSVLVATREVPTDLRPWAVSVVTLGELEAGVLLAEDHERRRLRLARLSRLVSRADVLPVDRDVATAYAELRAVSGRRPSNDLWIAATALALDLELVTADQAQARLPRVRARLI